MAEEHYTEYVVDDMLAVEAVDPAGGGNQLKVEEFHHALTCLQAQVPKLRKFQGPPPPELKEAVKYLKIAQKKIDMALSKDKHPLKSADWNLLPPNKHGSPQKRY